MKKLLVIGICALMTAAASAQDVMVVENKDNTTTEFNVDDIQRVYFKEKGGTEVNPVVQAEGQRRESRAAGRHQGCRRELGV